MLIDDDVYHLRVWVHSLSWFKVKLIIIMIMVMIITIIMFIAGKSIMLLFLHTLPPKGDVRFTSPHFCNNSYVASYNLWHFDLLPASIQPNKVRILLQKACDSSLSLSHTHSLICLTEKWFPFLTNHHVHHYYHYYQKAIIYLLLYSIFSYTS